MQNKILVAAVAVLSVAVLILGIEIAILNSQVASLGQTITRMNQRDRVELDYKGQMIKIPNYTYATMAISFQVDSGILYDCTATVSYIAGNGSTVHLTKELGVLNLNTNDRGVGFELTDYPVETSFLVNFSRSNPLPLVQVEAYGYTRP
ncbi:hypothetical protein GX563_05425 [Candidatus Bathyarchaeota archaeon]|nr:hypothetical protein [Candidatus Bathyarchaeota archaeon]